MVAVLARWPTLRRLIIAAFCLAVLAVLGWFVSDAVSADFPQQPSWDLGSRGPWVASYARGIAVGAWMAARVCLIAAGLVLLLELLSQAVGAIRRFARRRGRPAA